MKLRKRPIFPEMYRVIGSVEKTGRSVDRRKDRIAPERLSALKTFFESFVPKLFSRNPPNNERTKIVGIINRMKFIMKALYCEVLLETYKPTSKMTKEYREVITNDFDKIVLTRLMGNNHEVSPSCLSNAKSAVEETVV